MFDEQIINDVWNKGLVDDRYNPELVRKDACGAWIIRDKYNDRENPYGWVIDPTLTSFYEVLNQQLLRISSPSYWQLFYSWMHHHSERLLRRTTIGKGVDTDTDVNKNDINLQNMSIQTEKSHSAGLDFVTEYLQYRQWKKSAGEKGKLKVFCTDNGISYRDMIAWLRVNKPEK